MRRLALLLQVIIPGAIGLYLAFAMAFGLHANPAKRAREELALMIILGGAVIGFLTWLFGLIADRLSLIRLVLTVLLSMLVLPAYRSFAFGPRLGLPSAVPRVGDTSCGSNGWLLLAVAPVIGTATG